MRTLATVVEYKQLSFLEIGQVLKILCHTLKFLHGSQWEKTKMRSILKMDGRRAKGMKIWDSWCLELHM